MLLTDKRIEEHFDQVRTWAKTAGLSFFDRKAHTGFLRYVVIRSTSLGQTMINVITSSPKDHHEHERAKIVLQALAKQANPTTLIWSINHTITDVSFGDEEHIISGPGYIKETIDTHHCHISPKAFFQTSLYAAPIFLQTVKKCIQNPLKKPSLIYIAEQAFSLLPLQIKLSVLLESS